ncbi:MAG: DUF3040 domain-containing protein [Actinomycetales bacterium]|jgi:uncharacterized membrane protein HdeD (DUF308 family)
MPLSDHEKKLLAEMEEALAADDPRLLSTFSGKTPSRSRVVIGFLLIVAGLAVLLAAMISKTPILGVFGFAISLSGSVLAISNLGGLALRSPKVGKSSKWSTVFEERWDRRSE